MAQKKYFDDDGVHVVNEYAFNTINNMQDWVNSVFIKGGKIEINCDYHIVPLEAILYDR